MSSSSFYLSFFRSRAHTAAISSAEARSLRPATIEEAPEEEEAAEEQSDEDEDPEQARHIYDIMTNSTYMYDIYVCVCVVYVAREDNR